jgi:ATP-dependent Lhr-like helicase
LLPARDPDPTRRAHALGQVLLERHGVLTRGAVAAEHVAGGWSAVYPVLRAAEDAGRARRGYFVEGLGAAQFVSPGAVDRLRDLAAAPREPAAQLLAATDPANPYGAALAWPATAAGHRPGRKAGAVVVLVDGQPVLYVERGGRSLISFNDDPAALQPAADALALAVREGGLGRLAVERADGNALVDSALASALQDAGFTATPRGLRLRG